MTKLEFKHKYPDGLNNTMTLFMKALHFIMTSEEIDKVIEQARGRERRWLKQFKTAYLKSHKDWNGLFWAETSNIDSPRLFGDVLTVMAMMDKQTYNGENEEE